MNGIALRTFLFLGLVVVAIGMLGCAAKSNSAAESTASGSSSGTGGTSGSGGTGGTVSNVQTITVNAGPAGAAFGADYNYLDGAFTSVTVCAPGSTTNCQTIGGILVDTGSSGLRILSSALTASLQQQTNSGGSEIAECGVFEDGITWGPVQTADVKMAGETASAVPIQVVGAPNFSSIPSDCTSQGEPMDTLQDMGANGLLGIGQAIQDCGAYCTEAGSAGAYYACPASVCVDTTEAISEQVQNPVASFATDNNGVIIELPAVTGAEVSVTGSMIFGIGTQSNNGLGGATVFGTDSFGDLVTTYKSKAYTSFADSGSNGIYFLDATTTGLPVCSDINFLYCPTSTQSIPVLNSADPGTNGASGSTSFSVANADSLLTSASTAAVAGLAGPGFGGFDFGLPFFFGRNIYTAIDGKSTPGGTGPYLAY